MARKRRPIYPNATVRTPTAPVRVDVRYREECVDVEVVNAAGACVVGQGTGRGLIGLGERIAVFGGQIEVGPEDNGDWRLAASLPVAR